MRVARFLLVLVAACAATPAAALRDPGLRAEVARTVLQTLEEQRHYFPDTASREAFAGRLQAIAETSQDPRTFYLAVGTALATLGDGHTGLSLDSAELAPTETVPPVAILEAEDQPVVAGVAPGIEGGGLRPGDLILEIDGIPVRRVLAARLQETTASTPHARRAHSFRNLLAGPTGEPARVKVQGVDGRERMAFPVRFLIDDEGRNRFSFGGQRDTIQAMAIDLVHGYVALPDFQPGRARELGEAIRPLLELPALVLDLRGNPGGLIHTMQEIAGVFVDGGKTLLLLEGGRRTEKLPAIHSKVRYRGRLKVLVDAGTGSAAELLAAALRDVAGARLFGSPTAGSTRPRQSLPLPGGALLYYSGPMQFRRLDGTAVEGAGVAPDLAYVATRAGLAEGGYGDPAVDPLVRLAASSP